MFDSLVGSAWLRLTLISLLGAVAFTGCAGSATGGVCAYNGPCAPSATCVPRTTADGGQEASCACNVDGGTGDAGRQVQTSDQLGCEPDPCTSSERPCSAEASCEASHGVAVCSCKTSLGYTGDGYDCQPADSCNNGTANCDWGNGASCTNMPGFAPPFVCHCPSGYEAGGMLDGGGSACTSDDFCDGGTSLCGPMGTCADTPGSYTCTCATGYELNDGGVCAETDNCLTANCSQYATCTNSVGSYACDCMMGYTGNGFYCGEVNGCDSDAGTNPCDPSTTTCTPTGPGTVACDCLSGFAAIAGNPNACASINYCGMNPGPCPANALCNDTRGSFACTCPNHTTFNPATGTCNQIDYCGLGMDSCDPEATCANNVGVSTGTGYICTCKPGFTGTGTTCTDVNECSMGLASCGANSVCVNTFGSYYCACKSGYQGDGQTCTDIDECTISTPCSVNATCTNTAGSYSCTCDPHYMGTGLACAGIDYCGLQIDTCDLNATCTDDPTSALGYTCACNTGFAGDGLTCTSTNPCTSGQLTTCSPNATCAATGVTSYSCACKRGYSGDGTTCTAIDFCGLNQDKCDPNSLCQDTPGSYSCTCDTGYGGNGFFCANVQECEEGLGNCDTNASCTDVPGSFLCGCNFGYSGDGHTCTEINPCTNGTSNCDAHATCSHNEPGLFSCACNMGYIGNGTTCAVETPCNDGTAKCDATFGTCTVLADNGFMCGCVSGYQLSGSGTSCESIPYCTNGQSTCSAKATCTDTPGSYTCACPTGYTTPDNGRTCLDSNECGDGTAMCDVLATCTNSPGSYSCACPSGYTTSDQGGHCNSIQYCEDATDQCSPLAMCMDTPGSYACACPTFYSTTDSGRTCTPINPCTNGTSGCGQYATCTYEGPGMSTCSCPSGFTQSGNNCNPIPYCEDNPSLCAASASCTDTPPGSYTCTCPAGDISPDSGKTCLPDPCADNPCDTVSTTCTPNPQDTSYTCDCNAGYVALSATQCQLPCVDYGTLTCTSAADSTGGGSNSNQVTLSSSPNYRFAWPGVGNAAIAATYGSIVNGVHIGELHYLIGTATPTDLKLSSNVHVASIQTNPSNALQGSAIWVDSPNTTNFVGNASYAALSATTATGKQIVDTSNAQINTVNGDMFYGPNGHSILFVGNVNQSLTTIGNLYFYAGGATATLLATNADAYTAVFTADHSWAVIGVNATLSGGVVSNTSDLLAVNMTTGAAKLVATGVLSGFSAGSGQIAGFAVSSGGTVNSPPTIAFINATTNEIDTAVVSTTPTIVKIAGTGAAPALSADGSLVAYFYSTILYVSSTTTPGPIFVGTISGSIKLPGHFSANKKAVFYFSNVTFNDHAYVGQGYVGSTTAAPGTTTASPPPIQVSNQTTTCSSASGTNPLKNCRSSGYAGLFGDACGNNYLQMDWLFDTTGATDGQGIGRLTQIGMNECSSTSPSTGSPAVATFYADPGTDSMGNTLQVTGIEPANVVQLYGGASIAFLAGSGAGSTNGTPFIGSYLTGGAQITATGAVLQEYTATQSLVASPYATRVLLMAEVQTTSLDSGNTVTGYAITSDKTGGGYVLGGNAVLWTQGDVVSNPFMPATDGRYISVTSTGTSGGVYLIPVP